MNIGETHFEVPEDRPAIVLRRTFHAPAHALFEAMSKPEQVERWYGPARYRVEVPELDFREGGRWRFLNIDKADGTVWGFHGEFRKIVPDRRIEQTWIFEGAPDAVVEQTAELEERDGETTLTVTAVYPDFASRQGDLDHGANEGAAETYDRLAEVAGSIASASVSRSAGAGPG
ncbi:MAG TPA: SRPBCC domain-containing protein [Coriobacteriia bacterium]|jgi:uncharacterized protein YndB with AHSA1/START domain